MNHSDDDFARARQAEAAQDAEAAAALAQRLAAVDLDAEFTPRPDDDPRSVARRAATARDAALRRQAAGIPKPDDADALRPIARDAEPGPDGAN